jgi:hypothetical protein
MDDTTMTNDESMRIVVTVMFCLFLGVHDATVLHSVSPQTHGAVIAGRRQQRTVPRMPAYTIYIAMVRCNRSVKGKERLVGGASHCFSIYLNAIVRSC